MESSSNKSITQKKLTKTPITLCIQQRNPKQKNLNKTSTNPNNKTQQIHHPKKINKNPNHSVHPTTKSQAKKIEQNLNKPNEIPKNFWLYPSPPLLPPWSWPGAVDELTPSGFTMQGASCGAGCRADGWSGFIRVRKGGLGSWGQSRLVLGS